MTPPLWLIKALPYLGAVALAGGVVWYIDHRGYERAEEEAEARNTERQLLQAQLELKFSEMLRETEGRMKTRIEESDMRLAEEFGKIDYVNRTVVQPTLIREIQSEERFSDPSAGITDGMRGAINAARALSGRSCPAGTSPDDCLALPGTPVPE